MSLAQGRSLLGTVEIRPEVTMLSVLRHLNYKAWFALAEFIDNSLQSYIANRTELEHLHGPTFRLKVDLMIDTSGPGKIVISDNAAGISTEDFPRAFRAAQVPIDRSGLSEFGMGMKSAACWFAEKWSVRTKAIDEVVERTINFDIRQIVDNKIESLKTESRDADASHHYTVVSLLGLHHIPQGRTLGKIKAHLASIYRMYLRDGRLNLTLNGELLSYEEPAVLKAMPYSSPGVPVKDAEPLVWRKEVNLDFGEGQKVTGFAALREVGSTPLAGFALFRRDRLIEGSHDETYRPSYIFKQTNSYPYQRLFGELHVEGFEVSHTKNGFRWEEYEDEFLECLKEELESAPINLIAQAENYRALPTRKSIEKKAETATALVAKYLVDDVAPLLTEANKAKVPTPPLPASPTHSLLLASEKTVELDDGGWRWIITVRTSVDPIVEDWLLLAKEDRTEKDDLQVRRLFIDLALAHPFSSEFLGANFENVELLLRVAAAVAVSLVLTQDATGELPEVTLYHFNNLVRGALSRARIDDGNYDSSAEDGEATATLDSAV